MGLRIVSGCEHYHDPALRHNLVPIGFACINVKALEEAVDILARAIQNHLSEPRLNATLTVAILYFHRGHSSAFKGQVYGSRPIRPGAMFDVFEYSE